MEMIMDEQGTGIQVLLRQENEGQRVQYPTCRVLRGSVDACCPCCSDVGVVG